MLEDKEQEKVLLDYEDAERTIAGYAPQQEETTNRQEISLGLSFSLQLCLREAFSIKGDARMSKTATNVPLRASKPVNVDVEQEYDDDSVARMPRSAVRFRSTHPTQALNAPRTTDTLAGEAPAVTHRVSGTTRFLLWCLLLFCLAFLFNGLVLPAINSAIEQVRYGDAKIATYDLNNKHFLTEEANGRMRIVISNEDGSHNQVLTTMISNAPKHAVVSLTTDGNKLDVSVNGAYIVFLVPDGKGGYKWGNV